MMNNNVAHFFWFNSSHLGGIESHLKNVLTRSTNNHLFCGQPPVLPNERYLKILDYKSKYHNTENYDLMNLFRDLGSDTLINFHNPHVLKPEASITIMKSIRELNRNSKIVCTIHNFPKNAPKSMDILKQFDDILTVSSYMADLIYNFNGIKCKIVPYVLETNFPSDIKRSFPLDMVKIFQPTRFCNWKGSHHSLMAVVKLLDEGIPINFVHAGLILEDLDKLWDIRWNKQYSELYKKVRQYSETGRIRFIKYSSERYFEILRDFNLILHPTIGAGYEGDPYPLSLQMAVLNPIPILTTNSGGISEIVKGFSFANVVEPNKYEPLYERIKLLYNEKLINLTDPDTSLVREKREIISKGLADYNAIMQSIR